MQITPLDEFSIELGHVQEGGLSVKKLRKLRLITPAHYGPTPVADLSLSAVRLRLNGGDLPSYSSEALVDCVEALQVDRVAVGSS